LEAKRTAWYDNHDHMEKEKDHQDTNEHDLRMTSPIASIRHSFDQKLLVMKACVELLRESTHKEADLTRFGNHSPATHPHTLPEGTATAMTTNPVDSTSNTTTSSDSSEGRDIAGAFSWSPSHEKGMKQSIQKTLLLDRSLHD
jgi:hypothetical protein